MFKHHLKKRVFQNGYYRDVIVHTNARLGSRILDIHGNEIFEGDKVKKVNYDDVVSTVSFHDAAFFIADDIPLGSFADGDLEIIGHVDN